MDVDVSKMIIEMLMALPCLIVSLLLWWKIFRRRGTEKIEKTKLNLKELKEAFMIKNIRNKVLDWLKSLKLWKWTAAFIAVVIYLAVGIMYKGNNDITLIAFILCFLLIMFLSGIYSTEDLENSLLMIAAGMLGSRHGIFFKGFNAFYPLCSFIIAVILFLPGEIKTISLEGKNRIKKEKTTLKHERVVYYLSTGFLITSILYFLTSF